MDAITMLDTTIVDIRRMSQLISYGVPVEDIRQAFADRDPTTVFQLYKAAEVYLRYTVEER